jgi:hypothetical protein
VCSCLESDDLLTHRVSMMMVDRKFSREQSCQQGLRPSEHHGIPRSTWCLKSTSPYVAAFAIIVIVRPLVAHAAITNRIGRCSIYKRNCRKSRGTFGRSLSEHCPISRSMTSDATAVSPTDDFGKPHKSTDSCTEIKVPIFARTSCYVQQYFSNDERIRPQ